MTTPFIRASGSPFPRLHLVEIAELPWCPAAIRNGVTDYLQHVIDHGRPYAPVAPLLRSLVDFTEERVGSPSIVDIGAGAGGPWRALVEELGASTQVTLTDAFPNTGAFAEIERDSNGKVKGDRRPLRADQIPDSLVGTRTMFSAFHHLSREAAIAMLRRAAISQNPVAVFEVTRRAPGAMLLMLITPLLVWLMTPAIRPFRWSRILLTYVVPVIPLTVMFDGLVSCIRTYTPAELLEMAHEAAPQGVAWEAGLIGEGPMPVTYLTGRPI